MTVGVESPPAVAGKERQSSELSVIDDEVVRHARLVAFWRLGRGTDAPTLRVRRDPSFGAALVWRSTLCGQRFETFGADRTAPGDRRAAATDALARLDTHGLHLERLGALSCRAGLQRTVGQLSNDNVHCGPV